MEKNICYRQPRRKEIVYDDCVLEDSLPQGDWHIEEDPNMDYEMLLRGLRACAERASKPRTTNLDRISKTTKEFLERRRTLRLDLNASHIERPIIPTGEAPPRILPSEVRVAIKSVKLGAAPGPDFISADFFRAVEIGEGDNMISTMGQLKQRISEEANIDASCMKIIHRGKTISGTNDLSLLDLNIKENDKLLIMGKVSMAMKDDPGFSALVSYEQTNLLPLQKVYEDIDRDFTSMELNYLDVEKSLKMAKKMEKRLLRFTETCMKHLEALDGLNINGELTTEQQALRNREKRKSLVDGINSLLNGNDKQVRRLEEYRKKLQGEIIE
ncbi:hypothetical protein RB195_006915 [Necator americanus]|uniref:BAG family molecular chaperone regulator 1 n=2 Tax=Necator americanus TaxID=51031 RepID=A0ABR1BY52_NECAM